MHDIIREYGYLTLGSRLKRLGEQLQTDVTRLAQELGLPVPAGLFPLLETLGGSRARTVNELAQALGVSQPGVTRGVAQLGALGLVEVTRTRRDQRYKSVSLTAEGASMLARARRDMWPLVERAVRELCGEHEGPLLTQLARIEDALLQQPLDSRARELALDETEP